MKAAKAHGAVVSFDLNFREKLWSLSGGLGRAQQVLSRIVERVPTLKVVFEHVTTVAAVEFVRSARAGVAATITPQHLLLNRNALFEGGLRPHHYCLPVLKRERDRETLIAAATGEDARFFLGTDSAPPERYEGGQFISKDQV